MANPNPTKARQARARKRLDSVKTVDLNEARQALSLALSEIVERIDPELSTTDLCRLTGALVKATCEIRAIVEGVEFEARIAALEKANQPSLYGGARA